LITLLLRYPYSNVATVFEGLVKILNFMFDELALAKIEFVKLLSDFLKIKKVIMPNLDNFFILSIAIVFLGWAFNITAWVCSF